MPTNVNANAPPSQQDWTRACAKSGTRAAVEVLIAVGFVWLAVGSIYLCSAVGWTS